MSPLLSNFSCDVHCQQTKTSHIDILSTYLIVQQLFSGLGGILCIWRFNDSIDRTALLAETTVNALCHVNIVSSCSPASIFSLLGFDGNGLSRADLIAKSAGKSQKYAIGILTASQSLQAMHRSSPDGYRRRACSPLNRGEIGP